MSKRTVGELGLVELGEMPPSQLKLYPYVPTSAAVSVAPDPFSDAALVPMVDPVRAALGAVDPSGPFELDPDAQQLDHLQPLLEAARAYANAHASFHAGNAMTYELGRARVALCAAALAATEGEAMIAYLRRKLFDVLEWLEVVF